ncbi:MAG: hypothetical protein WD336_07925 [Trueperaceae bacterium]
MNARWLAIVLIVAGVAGLIANVGSLPPVPAAAWVAVALAAVWATWSRPGTNGRRLLITFLLGIAAMAGAGPLTGLVPTGVAAAAFLGVWWRERWRSWPLLAGGLTSAITITAMAGTVAPAWNPAPLFFLGFAATFALLYLLPPAAGGGQRWAGVPALVFTVLTVLINDPARSLPGWLLPLALITGGLALLSGVRRR